MTIESAIHQYNVKLREKTAKGEYREIEINYGQEENASDEDKNDDQKKTKSPNQDFNESKLSVPVKNFIQLIFDLNMMNRQMKEIGFNVKKMPLGKLAKSSIQKGY